MHYSTRMCYCNARLNVFCSWALENLVKTNTTLFILVKVFFHFPVVPTGTQNLRFEQKYEE